MQNTNPPGTRVFQAQYGHGTVTAANEYHTVVEFDTHGIRTFATSVVRLERSTTPAPEKVVKTRRRAAPRTQTAG